MVVFFRDNFKALIQASAGPEMGMMISGLGTNTIMNYITKAYTRYRDNKERLRAPKQPKVEKPAQHEDVKMEEEAKDETPEQKRIRFNQKWQNIIEADVEAMEEDEITQRPLSRAYLSLCPSSRMTNKQVQDEKNQSNTYLA